MSSRGSCALCSSHHCMWGAWHPVKSTRLTLRWNPVLGIYAHGACVEYLLDITGSHYGIDFTPIAVLAAGVETHEWELENQTWALKITEADQRQQQRRQQRFVLGGSKISDAM